MMKYEKNSIRYTFTIYGTDLLAYKVKLSTGVYAIGFIKDDTLIKYIKIEDFIKQFSQLPAINDFSK